MSNTIDINLEGTHPRESLLFLWNAIFKDGTHIFQIDKEGIEHKFKEVQDKFNDLVYFNLRNNNGKMFSINLMNGLIGYNTLEFPYIKLEKHKQNIRLIFFRRHTIELTDSFKEINHNIKYHMGIQYNDDKNNNHKIILIIDQEGNFIVTGE
jgi:hypothetical protein